MRIAVFQIGIQRHGEKEQDGYEPERPGTFIGKNGDKRCGWFVDYTKITDYYLFGWIKKADIPYDEEKGRYNTDAINKDNIKELDWALVKKKKIMKFLEKKGWTLDKLALQDKKIRENGGVRTKEFINDISFRYSDAYIEKPINILLKKETYMELAHLHGTIVCNEEQKDEASNNNVEGNRIILKSTIVNDNFTHLDLTVFKILSTFAVISIITIYSGGSSKVLSKAFCASTVILSLLSII